MNTERPYQNKQSEQTIRTNNYFWNWNVC